MSITANEYKPWEAQGITEVEYYNRRWLELSSQYQAVEQERDRLKEEVITLTAKIRARATMRLKDVQDDDSLRAQLSEERHKRELREAHDWGWIEGQDRVGHENNLRPPRYIHSEVSFYAFLNSQERPVQPEVCEWTWNPPYLSPDRNHYDKLGFWQTQCGRQTILDYTGEKFCQFCGKPIKEVTEGGK
jgi:hypothetical protein